MSNTTERTDTGQQLGVQLPDGRISPIREDLRYMAVTVSGRIIDRTPWTGYPIVEID
jgi:hypothetical protein